MRASVLLNRRWVHGLDERVNLMQFNCKNCGAARNVFAIIGFRASDLAAKSRPNSVRRVLVNGFYLTLSYKRLDRCASIEYGALANPRARKATTNFDSFSVPHNHFSELR